MGIETISTNSKKEESTLDGFGFEVCLVARSSLPSFVVIVYLVPSTLKHVSTRSPIRQKPRSKDSFFEKNRVQVGSLDIIDLLSQMKGFEKS